MFSPTLPRKSSVKGLNICSFAKVDSSLFEKKKKRKAEWLMLRLFGQVLFNVKGQLSHWFPEMLVPSTPSTVSCLQISLRGRQLSGAVKLSPLSCVTATRFWLSFTKFYQTLPHCLDMYRCTQCKSVAAFTVKVNGLFVRTFLKKVKNVKNNSKYV